MLNEPRSGTDLSQCLILQRPKSLVGNNILIYLPKYDDKIVIRFLFIDNAWLGTRENFYWHSSQYNNDLPPG